MSMKKETEKLIYSMQSTFFTYRGSIEEAKEELRTLLDPIPAKYSSPIIVAVGVLLNSIVAEVTVTENKAAPKLALTLNEISAEIERLQRLHIVTATAAVLKAKGVNL